MIRGILCLAGIFLLCCAETREVEIPPVGKKLENGAISLTLLPECGGRMQSCKAYGRELLLPCKVRAHQGNPLFAPCYVTGGGIRERLWKQNGTEAPLAVKCSKTAGGELDLFSPAYDNTCFALRKHVMLLHDGFRVCIVLTNMAKEARETALWITIVPVSECKLEFPGYAPPVKNGSTWYPADKGAPGFCLNSVQVKLHFPDARRFLSWCGELGGGRVRTVEAISALHSYAPGEKQVFFYEVHCLTKNEIE